MPEFDSVSLFIRNYKGIGAEDAGFSEIKPVNVIIGRNNSGKSALLDAVELICGEYGPALKNHHRGTPSEVIVYRTFPEQKLRRAFSENTSGGDIGGNHWHTVGAHFVNARIRLLVSGKSIVLDEVQPSFSSRQSDLLVRHRGRVVEAAKGVLNPFAGHIFKRVSAERDVRPEQWTGDAGILPNGEGVTRTIAYYLNRADQPSSVIEDELLSALNDIFFPDSVFENIYVQLIDNGAWEVFLKNSEGYRIALSSSGSGIKTVIQVLLGLMVVPRLEGRDVSEYIFGFEELENNLHPALQRRLFRYISRFVEERGCICFITTHASAVIDLFSGSNNSQVIHVFQKDAVSFSRPIRTRVDGRDILDDLDVRASDLLQANGIVWLEGPSDRIYFNRWMSLWTDGSVSEGSHYQCAYYGGKLLSHYTAKDASDADELVQALNINRHAIICIDSDKRSGDARSKGGKINSTKVRIVAEFERSNAIAWVTNGREIENYIPQEAINSYIGRTCRDLGQYEDISSYLEEVVGQGSGDRFERSKVDFARNVSPHLTKVDLESHQDFAAMFSRVVEEIKSWTKDPLIARV